MLLITGMSRARQPHKRGHRRQARDSRVGKWQSDALIYFTAVTTGKTFKREYVCVGKVAFRGNKGSGLVPPLAIKPPTGDSQESTGAGPG